MRKSDLDFQINECIRIKGRQYIITEKIYFKDEKSGHAWIEYSMFDDRQHAHIRWLSVDIERNEYIFYKLMHTQSESYIEGRGYCKVDEGVAVVTQENQNSNLNNIEQVGYKKFEAIDGKKVIKVEQCQGETACSSGYYLSLDEIYKEEIPHKNSDYKLKKDYANKSVSISRNKKRIGKLDLLAWFMIPMIGILLVKNIMLGTNEINLCKKIREDNRFNYITFIMADMDQNQSAEVYGSNSDVEDTAQKVLNLAGKTVESIGRDTKSKTVVIITKSHYCVVYQDNKMQTLIQVSSRKYVYSSSRELYRGTESAFEYYRDYYYTKAYMSDYAKYKGNSAYKDYGKNLNKNIV